MECPRRKLQLNLVLLIIMEMGYVGVGSNVGNATHRLPFIIGVMVQKLTE